MGRLTERDKYGLWVSTQHMTGQDTWIETYEEMLPAIIKLAHYEDLEEQGYRMVDIDKVVKELEKDSSFVTKEGLKLISVVEATSIVKKGGAE